MNHCTMSNGERIKRSIVDRKIREAKALRLQMQIDEIGYNRCEVCKRNDCIPVECSHDISVDYCVKNGCVELAWDVNNITPTGHRCHQIKDSNLIMSGKK